MKYFLLSITVHSFPSCSSTLLSILCAHSFQYRHLPKTRQACSMLPDYTRNQRCVIQETPCNSVTPKCTGEGRQNSTASHRVNTISIMPLEHLLQSRTQHHSNSCTKYDMRLIQSTTSTCHLSIGRVVIESIIPSLPLYDTNRN